MNLRDQIQYEIAGTSITPDSFAQKMGQTPEELRSCTDRPSCGGGQSHFLCKSTRRSWLGRMAAVSFGAVTANQRYARAEMKRPARSCIVLWMEGGPSQMDTFDLKPGHANGGPFKEIQTSTPEIRISEHLPMMAERAQHLALIRSMSTVEGDHRRASDHLHKGYQGRTNVDFPSLGSLVANERRSSGSMLPAYVNIAPAVNLMSSRPGFLGSTLAPLIIRPTASGSGINNDPETPIQLGVDYLLPPQGTEIGQAMARADLLQSFNQDFATRRPDAVSKSHRIAYERAIKMMRPEIATAFDLSDEPAALRTAYGNDAFGQGCLLARRLVERGVGFVEVTLGAASGVANWDTHTRNFPNVEQLCGRLDRSWSRLMDDLKQRGLLDSTLIVWMGEFGRTPKINTAEGRDHFPDAWTTVLAGGGIQGGQVLGRTSADGMKVEDRPVSVRDFISTICLALGVDPDKQNVANDGQPIRIAESGADPLRQLLSL